MKIIIHNDETVEMLESIKRRHPEVTLYSCNNSSELPGLIKDVRAEVIFSVNISCQPYPAKEILCAESLRWISVGGVGTDHLGQWDPQKITVTNAAGAGAVSIAQYVFAGLLSFSFKLQQFAEDKRQRCWNGDASVSPIAGKTILIIGLGATGTEVARLAKSFGLKTLGVRVRPKSTEYIDELYSPDRLGGLWPRADFIVVCVPLLPTTRNLISEQAFRKMSDQALLIDVSRGGVVDQNALLSALNGGSIGGAVRDVFDPEPLPENHPLWQAENLIISPHCSSIYDGWDKKAIEMFCDNLQRYKKGERLNNVVDPVRGY